MRRPRTGRACAGGPPLPSQVQSSPGGRQR